MSDMVVTNQQKELLDIKLLISRSAITEMEIISIENGTNNSMEVFLKYIHALDCYFYLSNKNNEVLNFQNLIKQIDNSNNPGN